VFGYEDIYSVDGINPVSCKDFTIDDCFMRCRDDCVAIKSMDYKLSVDSIRVINSVMVGWANSDGVTIGFELNGGPVQNILVSNCDILYARGNGRTGGHSAFSIVCDGPARVQKIRYENIRVEEHVEFKNLEMIISDGKLYGIDPPGHISEVYFKNIQWENDNKPFILTGFSDSNVIENITFESCTAGGNKIKSLEDAGFKIGSFVKDVRFRN
jgi:polygalacturonase